ncbi:MAG TPA: hypothetical protein VFL93_17570 [Longimicrobiaceae bacterium]|nr:hypothetical protein [Longimicrobiaceae bacterium]
MGVVFRGRGAGLLLVLALVVSGCASARNANNPAQQLQVKVVNNLTPSEDLSIYLQPGLGARRLLGSVGPGQTRTLTTSSTGASGQFVLVARTLSGQSLVSNPIVAGSGQTIVWDLRANVARLDSE